MNPVTPDSLQLRDIHLPGTPGFWPPAPGWWLLAAIILALTVWLGLIIRRRLKIHRQRKHILNLLAQLEQSSADAHSPEFLAQLSRLLRRLALMRFPRQEIASLTGKAWLQFLDASGGNGQFCDGPGRVLANGPYVRDLDDNLDTHALSGLIRDWIKKNTGA